MCWRLQETAIFADIGLSSFVLRPLCALLCGMASVQEEAEPHDPPASPQPSGSSSSSSSSDSEQEDAADNQQAVETPVDRMVRLIGTLGAEDTTVKRSVYLGTFSRVLPETSEEQGLIDAGTLSRQELAEKVRDAWEHPALDGGRGRPRDPELQECAVVEKLVVFREAHGTGDVHYHVALKLSRSLRFRAAKAALRERHSLASHWSCTHTQFFSAIRYGHIPSETKPNVDQEPYSWTADGRALDLYAESQEPFMAKAWKRRREENDKKAATGEKKTRATFTKLDLTALVLDQGLQTKAAVMEYSQDNGSAAMQVFVHQNQRKLKDFLEDASEWAAAREVACSERESAWDRLCRMADTQCSRGDSCTYASCAAEVFDQNKDILSKEALAFALRGIIIKGPSKTTRTPLIVGSTNTGKTTLILPFDKLFGFKHVFHKPALGSKFALRNIMKDKHFLLWDDFRPVQYAQDTVPTATQLSLFTGLPFEVQVSQSFNDGNVDFEWRHGAVVTAKEEGLWSPCRGVTEEDVRHLQSRFEVFRCTTSVKRMRDVDGCACHMSKWIRDGAAAQDARSVLQPVLPTTTHKEGRKLQGFEVLVFEAQVPPAVAEALEKELLQLGAVSVRELPADEWLSLDSWRLLKPLEQRRVRAWLR